jgi:hypothetical protein
LAPKELHNPLALTGPALSNWQVPQPAWLPEVKKAHAAQFLPATADVST